MKSLILHRPQQLHVQITFINKKHAFYDRLKLENFILNTEWCDLPEDVQNRMKGCFIDLLGALIAGSKSSQAKVGLALAEKILSLVTDDAGIPIRTLVDTVNGLIK